MKKQIALIAGIVITVSAWAQTKEITLDDIYVKRKFVARTISGNESMKGGEFYTTCTDYKNIIRWEYKTGNIADTVFSLTKSAPAIQFIYDYQFNSTETRILFSTSIKPIYRRSFMADYYIFDLKTQKLMPLSKNGQQQLADFSPDGNKVAFVRNNNLFIRDLNSDEEKQITTDGKKNFIINGAPDWVYEEEFGFSKGFVWSADGQYLAFMRFDESKVRTYTLTYYEGLYPINYEYKYPKAGEANSVVSVHLYRLSDGTTVKADVGEITDQYIPRILWTKDPSKLAIVRLNRLQNKVDVLLAEAATGKSTLFYTDTNKYYISEVDDHFINFLEDRNQFIVFSERDGYNHLYLYGMDGKLKRNLTPGEFDVTEYYGCDLKNQTVYYASCEPSPIQTATYSVKLDGSKKQLITSQGGTNKTEFSRNFAYYINTYSNANTPPVVTLSTSSNKTIKVLEDNKELISAMKEYGFSRKDFFEFFTQDGTRLTGYVIYPNNYDPSKKHPLFMFVYGGPQSQEVTNGWDMSVAWFHLLAQKGYVVACVDNRGTENRGEAFRKATYMQLGKYEVEDQIAAAKYMGSQPGIDSTRIGIFGWSYGGYMASLCMTRGADVFKMGIAVAPVTNWRYYDNIYTERFMRTPQENSKGYDDNSPINFASLLKGKFLLIHGSADDNVHLQNTMEFSEKLIQAKKQFDLMIYPNKNHGIYGGNTRIQLYTKMTDYILNNL